MVFCVKTCKLGIQRDFLIGVMNVYDDIQIQVVFRYVFVVNIEGNASKNIVVIEL